MRFRKPFRYRIPSGSPNTAHTSSSDTSTARPTLTPAIRPSTTARCTVRLDTPAAYAAVSVSTRSASTPHLPDRPRPTTPPARQHTTDGRQHPRAACRAHRRDPQPSARRVYRSHRTRYRRPQLPQQHRCRPRRPQRRTMEPQERHQIIDPHPRPRLPRHHHHSRLERALQRPARVHGLHADRQRTRSPSPRHLTMPATPPSRLLQIRLEPHTPIQ